VFAGEVIETRVCGLFDGMYGRSVLGAASFDVLLAAPGQRSYSIDGVYRVHDSAALARWPD